MKIVTQTLESIAEIQIFPIIGLIIFFSMFVILLYNIAKLTKRQEDEYSKLPLDKDDDLRMESNEKVF